MSCAWVEPLNNICESLKLVLTSLLMLMVSTLTHLDVDSFSSYQCWLNFPILAAILYGFLFTNIFHRNLMMNKLSVLSVHIRLGIPRLCTLWLRKWFKVEGKQIWTTIYLADCKKVRWWEGRWVATLSLSLVSSLSKDTSSFRPQQSHHYCIVGFNQRQYYWFSSLKINWKYFGK